MVNKKSLEEIFNEKIGKVIFVDGMGDNAMLLPSSKGSLCIALNPNDSVEEQKISLIHELLHIHYE